MMHALSLLVLVTALGQPAAREPATVPAFVVEEAAKPETVAFGLSLLRARVPCGMEIREEDYDWGYRPDHTRPLGESRPLREAIAVFERRHPAYRVIVSSGVVLVRPRTDTLRFLDAPSPLGAAPTTIAGPLTAIRTVFDALHPRQPGAVDLNTMGYSGWDRKVVLQGAPGHTVQDVLAQVARQLPGSAWLVTTTKVDGEIRVAELSVLESNGDRQFYTLHKKR